MKFLKAPFNLALISRGLPGSCSASGGAVPSDTALPLRRKQMDTTLGTAGAQAAAGLRTVSSPAVSPWSCSSPLPPQCSHRAPAWAVLGDSPPEPPHTVGATRSLQKANLGCCFVLRAQKKPSQAGWLHFFRLKACMRPSPPSSFGEILIWGAPVCN